MRCVKNNKICSDRCLNAQKNRLLQPCPIYLPSSNNVPSLPGGELSNRLVNVSRYDTAGEQQIPNGVPINFPNKISEDINYTKQIDASHFMFTNSVKYTIGVEISNQELFLQEILKVGLWEQKIIFCAARFSKCIVE